MNGTYRSFPIEMRDSTVVEDIVWKDGKSGDPNPTRAFLCSCVTNVPNRDPRREVPVIKYSMIHRPAKAESSVDRFIRNIRNSTRGDICDGKADDQAWPSWCTFYSGGNVLVIGWPTINRKIGWSGPLLPNQRLLMNYRSCCPITRTRDISSLGMERREIYG